MFKTYLMKMFNVFKNIAYFEKYSMHLIKRLTCIFKMFDMCLISFSTHLRLSHRAYKKSSLCIVKMLNSYFIFTSYLTNVCRVLTKIAQYIFRNCSPCILKNIHCTFKKCTMLSNKMFNTLTMKYSTHTKNFF